MKPLLIVCLVGLWGCTSKYVYEPAEHATAQIRGHLAADYAIPPQAPLGDVRIASFGMSNITPTKAPGEQERAVHLRMIIADNSPQPWRVNTRSVRVSFPDEPPVSPAYVRTRQGEAGLPMVYVPAGGKRVVDLFYPLPAGMQHASRIPDFDALWRVHTATQTIAERTPFDRLRVQPPPDYYDWDRYGYGPDLDWYGDWGGPVWYDPDYDGALPPDFEDEPVFIDAPSWGGDED